MVKQERSVATATRRSLFLDSSGLDRFSLETKINPKKPDRIYIIYRDPVTGEEMKTPDGNANIITSDCSTTLSELPILASNWLASGCDVSSDWCNHADLNHIDGVDLKDLAEFSSYWLAEP